MRRRFTEKEQTKLAETLLRHSKHLTQPNINLELVDGELVETGGTWRHSNYHRTESDNTERDDS